MQTDSRTARARRPRPVTPAQPVSELGCLFDKQEARSPAVPRQDPRTQRKMAAPCLIRIVRPGRASTRGWRPLRPPRAGGPCADPPWRVPAAGPLIRPRAGRGAGISARPREHLPVQGLRHPETSTWESGGGSPPPRILASTRRRETPASRAVKGVGKFHEARMHRHSPTHRCGGRLRGDRAGTEAGRLVFPLIIPAH